MRRFRNVWNKSISNNKNNSILFRVHRLYFWIYRPHNLLYKYFTVCLFDDHGVDNIKTVTMSQWKSNPRVLIVHGGGGCESEDSYITVVGVPNLGCLDCKKLRDEFYSDVVDRKYPNKANQSKCNGLCVAETLFQMFSFVVFCLQRIDVDIYASSAILRYTPNTVGLIRIQCLRQTSICSVWIKFWLLRMG